MHALSAVELRVSIDVGCYRHRVAVGLSDGRLLSEFEIAHDHTGFEEFFARIGAYEQQYQCPVAVAMEGYNGWGRPLDQLILKQNYRLFNINSLKLARYKEIFPGAAKTDAIDARKGLELFTLSEHLPLAKNSLQAVLPAPEVNDKLKRLSRRRRRLVIERVAVKSALHSDLQAVCPELLAITKDIDQVWYLNLLTSVSELPKLARKQAASLAQLRGVGTLYLSKIRAWQKSAQFSAEVDWVGPMILEDARRLIELGNAIKSLDAQMAALSQQSDIARCLLSLPGFGSTCCAELAGEIGTIDRFEHESSLALYLGMAPLDNASGTYKGVKTPSQVNKRAKMAMMTAVDHHRRNVAQSQAFYAKKRAQGKTHNQAIRALGRYLCKVMFKMLNENRLYEIQHEKQT
jgi:transposase